MKRLAYIVRLMARAAAKTFWSRQDDDLLYVEFPKDSPLEDKVLKAQAAFEEDRKSVV